METGSHGAHLGAGRDSGSVSVCLWLQTTPHSDHHGYSRPS